MMKRNFKNFIFSDSYNYNTFLKMSKAYAYSYSPLKTSGNSRTHSPNVRGYLGGYDNMMRRYSSKKNTMKCFDIIHWSCIAIAAVLVGIMAWLIRIRSTVETAPSDMMTNYPDSVTFAKSNNGKITIWVLGAAAFVIAAYGVYGMVNKSKRS